MENTSAMSVCKWIKKKETTKILGSVTDEAELFSFPLADSWNYHSTGTYAAHAQCSRRRHMGRPLRSADGFIIVYLPSNLSTQSASELRYEGFWRAWGLLWRNSKVAILRVTFIAPGESTMMQLSFKNT